MIRILILIIVLLNVTSCQSTKDALTLKKKNNSDEFLVEKKSPLVLPPDYGKLPQPNEAKMQDLEKKDVSNDEVLNSLIKTDSLNQKTLKNTEPTSLEKTILKKIK